MTDDDVGEPAPSKKEKKARAHPRTRRRLRRPDAAATAAAAEDSSGANDAPTDGDSQSTRWVIVSRSDTSAARRGKPPLAQLRVDRTATSSEGGTDNGQHQQQGCAAICESEPASPLTPRQDLLPVSLLSPATSSGTPGKRRARPRTPPVYSLAQHAAQHDAHRSKGVNGKRGEDLAQKGRGHMPNRWTPRRGRGGEEERGTFSGKEGLQVFDMSPRLTGSTGRTGAFNSVRELAGGGLGDDSGADESSQGLWATMGATSAFWLDLPAQVNSTPGQEYMPEGGEMWKKPLHEGGGEGEELLSDENEVDVAERRRWQEWARHAAEHERQRRIQILEGMDREEHRERLVRRAWALSAMDEEQRRRASQQFLLSIEGTNWFQGTISSVDLDYEIVCPYSSLGCRHICLRTELDKHLAKDCRFNNQPEDSDFDTLVDASEYEVVCPNTILGCDHSCSRSSLTQHLETCRFTGPDVKEEEAERARSLQMVLQQAEEERARRVAHDAKGDWQSDSLALKTRQFLHRLLEDQMKTALVILHKEILECAARCRQIQARRKQELEDTWRRLEGVIGLLWPGAKVLQYGSYASGMMTPDSDVDLVVFPMGGRGGRTSNFYRRDGKTDPPTPSPVPANPSGKTTQGGMPRTPARAGLSPVPAPALDADLFSLSPSPVKGEAAPKLTRGASGQSRKSSSKPTQNGSSGSHDGSWEGRRGGRIHDLADHLRNNAPFLEVVKVLHHARVPIIKAVAKSDGGSESGDNFRVNIDISVDGPTHTGLATSAFVSYLADHLPNLVPLTIVLKSLLQSKGLNDPYTGGLSSYGLVLMVAFALLRRDHFPPSPAGPSFADADFIQRSTPDRTPSQRATPPPSDREKAPDREKEERGGDERRATPPTLNNEKEERRATPSTPSKEKGERVGVDERCEQPEDACPSTLSRTLNQRANPPPPDKENEEGGGGVDERRVTPSSPRRKKGERGGVDEQPEDICAGMLSRTPSRRATPHSPEREKEERGDVGERRATASPPDRKQEEGGGDEHYTSPPAPHGGSEERGGGEQPEEACPTTMSPTPSRRAAATPPSPDREKEEPADVDESCVAPPTPSREKEECGGGAEHEQPEEICPATLSRTPSRRATQPPPEREREERGGVDERRATPPPPDKEREERGGVGNCRATPPTPDKEKEERGGDAEHEQLEEACPAATVSPRSRSVSENRPDVKDSDFSIPPSPGHSDGLPAAILQFSPASKVEETWRKKSMAPSVGRQRGFWQRPSLVRGGSGFTGMLARDARAGNRTVKRQTPGGGGQSMSSWDRPRQQYWVGSRTARAVLMQEFHACAPTPAPAAVESDHQSSAEVRGGSQMASEPRADGGIPISSVPPPPPPPLPQPVADFCLHPMMPPLSPYITSGEEPVLGELLLDFLHLFGEDFDMAREGFSVRGGGFRFCVHDHPPHPQAGDPIVIEDPLNCMNNVGRGSFGIGQVQRALFEALTTLKAKMVRVNQDGKEVLGSDGGSAKTHTGILRHICSPHAA